MRKQWFKSGLVLGVLALPFLLSACSRGWTNLRPETSLRAGPSIHIHGDPAAQGKILREFGWPTVIVFRNNEDVPVFPAFLIGMTPRYQSGYRVPPGGRVALRIGPDDTKFVWVREDGVVPSTAPEALKRLPKAEFKRSPEFQGVELR